MIWLRALWRDRDGSTTIETALILPALLAMSMGTFDVSRMVARQNELQKAANEAGDVVIAANPDTQSKKDTLKAVIMTSTGLAQDKVTISNVYRCGVDASFVTLVSACAGSFSTFVRVVLTDTYTPTWTKFGLGGAVNYSVTRQVQVS